MKKHIFLTAFIALTGCLFAQGNDLYDPARWCLGWHNPTSFTYVGGDANTSWVGLKGSKPAQASTCTNGLSWTGTIVQAGDLASESSSSSCTTVSTFNYQGQNDMNNRFSIKGSGTASETGGRLTYLPAEYTDGVNHTMVEGFTSSIRLGNFCGNGEAEALRYQFDVRPGNALMTVYYALSLQNGQHNAADNPEFVIYVEKAIKNSANQITGWQRIGGDSLCYIQPTPTTSNTNLEDAPNATGSTNRGYNFYVGTTGTHQGASNGCNVYLPWNKVTIPLYNYLYQTIRITIGAGDCSMTAHYACAYIAGDCAPMSISTAGCSAGENDTVTILTAPAGMRSYQWYKNKTTHLLTNTEASDLSNLEAIQGATSQQYWVRARDFAVRTPGTGVHDTTWLPQTTMVCATGSLMNVNNPDLIITSFINTEVGNTKPTVRVDTIQVDCNNGISLRDISWAQYTKTDLDRVDTSVTEWEFYNSRNPLRGESPLATLTGPTAHFDFSTPGAHSVKVKVASYTTDDAGNRDCWNKVTIPIRTMSRPTISCAFDSVICAGEEVLFTNVTQHVVDGRTYNASPQNGTVWHFWDGQGLDSTTTSFGNNWSMRLFETTDFTLNTYVPNIYWEHDTTGDGIPERLYCDNTGTFRVRVEQYPQLTVLGDTIVCEGQLSTVQVQSDVPVSRYKWCTRLDSAFCVQTGNTMQEVPQGSKTYYVMAATPNNCISWDSLSIRLVNPVLTVPVNKMCDGDYLYLYGSGASTYTWESSPWDGSMETSPNGDTLRVSPNGTTLYTMVGHGTNGCNADAKTESIIVYHYPEMAFEMSPDFIDSEKPEVTFKDVSRYAVRSLWDFGNGNTSNERQLTKTFTALTEDSIYITLTSFNELNCLSDTAFYVPVSLFAVWFPTAFTPTLSTNRTFHLFTNNDLEYFSIYIYNRAGDLVFYSTDPHFQWDGKHNGRYCDQGTYVYTCNYRRPGTTDIVTRKGTVLMLQ